MNEKYCWELSTTNYFRGVFSKRYKSIFIDFGILVYNYTGISTSSDGVSASLEYAISSVSNPNCSKSVLRAKKTTPAGEKNP